MATANLSLELSPIADTFISGLGGMNVVLSKHPTVPIPRDWTNRLASEPVRILSSIRRQKEVFGGCLSQLGECETCTAERTSHPQVRQKVESIVVSEISEHMKRKNGSLSVAMFGDSGLFSTLLVMQKLIHTQQWRTFHVSIIDFAFGVLCCNQERTALQTDEEKTEVDNRGPKMKARLAQILAWLDKQQQQNIRVHLSIFHHASR